MHPFAQPPFHPICIGVLREGFLRSIQLVLQVKEGGGDHSRSSLREFHIFEYVHFWENEVVTTGQQERLCGGSERDVCLN